MKVKRFKLKRKVYSVVRYYETAYTIYDNKGDQFFSTTDSGKAREFLRLLNGYCARQKRKAKRKARKAGKRKTRKAKRK